MRWVRHRSPNACPREGRPADAYICLADPPRLEVELADALIRSASQGFALPECLAYAATSRPMRPLSKPIALSHLPHHPQTGRRATPNCDAPWRDRPAHGASVQRPAVPFDDDKVEMWKRLPLSKCLPVETACSPCPPSKIKLHRRHNGRIAAHAEITGATRIVLPLT